LNFQRFQEFCRQERLNPRAPNLRVITRLEDVYQLAGVTEFDLVFLRDYSLMPRWPEIQSEILMRSSFPYYKGTVYYFET